MSSTFEKVQEIIADALYVEKDECARNATLMGDLGAESIDFLDIIFRLEKEFSIKIPKGEIETKARGGLSDDEFAVGGIIQPKGLESLRKAMPEVDPAAIKDGLNVRDISSLFTVSTFETMVMDQLGESAPAAASGLQPALSSAGTRI
jgi:acyl carrier protein